MFDTTLRSRAPFSTSALTGSVRTDTSPSHPCNRRVSSSGVMGVGPSYRSTRLAESSLENAAEGIRRGRRTRGRDSVPVRLSVSTVIALHRGLDQTRSARLGQRIAVVAGVVCENERTDGRRFWLH